ncbi:MAG: hypothetical protein ACOCQD_00855 [archaeon]
MKLSEIRTLMFDSKKSAMNSEFASQERSFYEGQASACEYIMNQLKKEGYEDDNLGKHDAIITASMIAGVDGKEYIQAHDRNMNLAYAGPLDLPPTKHDHKTAMYHWIEKYCSNKESSWIASKLSTNTYVWVPTTSTLNINM